MKRDDESAIQRHSNNVPDIQHSDDGKSQLELNLAIPQTLRTEFNFLKYPFFDLSGDSKRAKIEINESVVTDEGAFRILWRVSRNVESRFPGDFEKRVHRAVEQIINATPKPITNPLRLGSVYYVARLMGINADSGKNYQDIQRALKNIVKTSVEAEGTFQLKDSKVKKFINDTFHLYERVIFKGEALPTGEVADAIHLMLGSWYLQNINNNYVVPLDWRFYNELSGSITTRMYEFLSIHFFVALEKKREYYDVRYKEICEYFPLVRQYPAWKARKQLKQAHEWLTQAGYFARVEWRDLSESDDWMIRYWIGSRARTEYERNKTEVRQLGDTTRPIPMPERRRQRVIEAGRKDNTAPGTPESPVLHEMVTAWGFSSSTAQNLVKRYSEDRIKEVLSWASWARQEKPLLIKKNAIGWIRTALSEEWDKPPVGFESPEERATKKKQREKSAKQLRDAVDAQQKEEEWREWYNALPEQRVRGDLFIWENLYRRDHGGQLPTESERLQKQSDLVAQLPSNEQKQRDVFGFVKYPEQA